MIPPESESLLMISLLSTFCTLFFGRPWMVRFTKAVWVWRVSGINATSCPKQRVTLKSSQFTVNVSWFDAARDLRGLFAGGIWSPLCVSTILTEWLERRVSASCTNGGACCREDRALLPSSSVMSEQLDRPPNVNKSKGNNNCGRRECFMVCC